MFTFLCIINGWNFARSGIKTTILVLVRNRSVVGLRPANRPADSVLVLSLASEFSVRAKEGEVLCYFKGDGDRMLPESVKLRLIVITGED